MSYCRFSWDGSDVYVFGSDVGLECCGCWLAREDAPGPVFESPEEMIAHLIEHKKAGHFVPFKAISSLWEEVSGPNKPVTPEPKALTDARESWNRLKNKKEKRK